MSGDYVTKGVHSDAAHRARMERNARLSEQWAAEDQAARETRQATSKTPRAVPTGPRMKARKGLFGRKGEKR